MLKKITGKKEQQYFIHLGLHKTATTALQSFLHKNAAALLTHDVRYIPLQRMRAEITPLFCSAEKSKRRRLMEQLEAFPNRRVLLSEENILGSPADIASGVLYPYAKNRVETFCEEAGNCPVTVFVTLREPASFFTSMYCEYIRHQDFIPFDEYVAPFDVSGFSYAKTFRWLKRLPGNARAIVMPFETSLGGGVEAIASRIIDEVAGPDSRVDISLFPKAKSRSSYSREEIDLATTIASKAGGKMAQVFLNALDSRNHRFGETGFAPISPDLCAQLKQRYVDELAEFLNIKAG